MPRTALPPAAEALQAQLAAEAGKLSQLAAEEELFSRFAAAAPPAPQPAGILKPWAASAFTDDAGLRTSSDDLAEAATRAVEQSWRNSPLSKADSASSSDLSNDSDESLETRIQSLQRELSGAEAVSKLAGTRGNSVASADYRSGGELLSRSESLAAELASLQVRGVWGFRQHGPEKTWRFPFKLLQLVPISPKTSYLALTSALVCRAPWGRRTTRTRRSSSVRTAAWSPRRRRVNCRS